MSRTRINPQMPRDRLLAVLSGTFLAMGALYGPQPLLPLFARIFGVSEAASASLITWSLLAMSVGPLFMGFLLQKYASKALLVACLLGLGISELAFAALSEFGAMKAIRFIQGALISALLAATMTYIAATAQNLRQALAYYVAAAVLGGLCGRIVAGYLSEYFSWRWFFGGMGAAFLACGLVSFLLPEGDGAKKRPFSTRRLFEVVGDRYIRRLFWIIAAGFFAMTGFLNFVPFRLEALDERLGESLISLFYLGFVFGFFVSSNAPRIADMAGGPFRAIGVGLTFVALGVVMAGIPSVIAVFVAVLLITSGFFLQHATTAALLNAYAGARAGDINSLYVAVYYMAGTAGSYFPGLVYAGAGWPAFVGLLGVTVLGAAALASRVEPPVRSTYESPLSSH